MNVGGEPKLNLISALAAHIFPHVIEIDVGRVAEGVSTFVYRICCDGETFFMRISPEEGASFAPEVVTHTLLCQRGAKVPDVVYFSHYDEIVQRSVMITTAVAGQPLCLCDHRDIVQNVLEEAGHDLALVNGIAVNGFGWVRRDNDDTTRLRATWHNQRAFVFEHWEADLAYLTQVGLQQGERDMVQRIVNHYGDWLDIPQATLAHGDFDTTHIFYKDGHYTGIIDFGEIRGTGPRYDLGHFHLHEPLRTLPALLQGYGEVVTLPADIEARICFDSLLIAVRALAQSLQKRPPNRYSQHLLNRVREDVAILSL